ncbi:MAG: hypothetical protein H7138_05930 [Myxococcales bacterium]|nr:hypothetical protein [Myxococcales bacterium]
MRHPILFLMIAATGCLDRELDDEPEVQTRSESAAIAGVCAQTRTAIGPVLTTGEVSAARSGTNLYVGWTGTTSLPGSIVKLDPQYRVTARWTMGATGPNLTGVLDLGSHVLAAYGTSSTGIVDMWQLSPDLSIANYAATYAGNPARNPFLSNPTGSARAYLWSSQKTLIASHMDPSGFAANGSMFDRTGTITELAGDNGGHDSAVVWVENLGGGVSRCSAGNIGFDVPSAPSLRTTRVVSTDCRRARIAAGPTDDIQVVVTASASGVVRAHFRRSGADMVHVLSASGRAAKVRFDGTRFWIAWRDTGVGALRIASIDPIGTLVYSPISGPVVVGDEAFDLVRTSTTTTALVALTPNSLDIVTLCR